MEAAKEGGLRVSLVLYDTPAALLARTAATLDKALTRLDVSAELVVVDNSPQPKAGRFGRGLPASGARVRYLTDQGNVGFGRGHNLAMAPAGVEFHLILNPDVELEPEALVAGLAFLRSHPECGVVAPAVRWPDGRPQFLCKHLPGVLDLALRGFAPAWLRKLFDARLARYEMRDRIGEEVVWDPPIVSGCCLLMRADLLRELGGFDPGYFLYFEDFDLSLRAARSARLAYVPEFRIVHHGGLAARKGWRHVAFFVRSAVRFFRTHGWRW